MELITTVAALIFLLCSQIQNTGALPVWHNHGNYQQNTSGNGKPIPSSLVKETVAAKTQNESPPCQIVPDDPLTGIDATPPPLIPVNKPGQDAHRTNPPLAPTASNPGRGTYQQPPPLPPNVFYQPIVPYYVLPPNPVSGGFYVYGQGPDRARFTPGRGRLPPHSPFGASGFLPASQWFLDLQRDKHLPVRNPAGNQRAPLLAQRSDYTSSEMSSEEDSDGD
ncbi:uncharacterized protein LOC127355286 [Dicentrarchus labrax]|uniref:uncharacterized protein LOC127355286 n=1 Tax=Dicentrarchus labrax TaxID=13489 RepID=UPI0021F64BB5|nr:uncharacterized protein LOC127355286 [Dicentrarchus labrax]